MKSNWSYSPETPKLGQRLFWPLWHWPLTDGRTDRRTDGLMERSVLRAAWSQLKMSGTLKCDVKMQGLSWCTVCVQMAHKSMKWPQKYWEVIYCKPWRCTWCIAFVRQVKTVSQTLQCIQNCLDNSIHMQLIIHPFYPVFRIASPNQKVNIFYHSIEEILQITVYCCIKFPPWEW